MDDDCWSPVTNKALKNELAICSIKKTNLTRKEGMKERSTYNKIEIALEPTEDMKIKQNGWQ